jgi:carboxyl-terminal processing protease
VLVDHNTASAAEILTAALAEHGLATVVGTRTFGKGTFQQAIDLSNGGALDLTIGRFFTANGTSTLDKGIKPDIHAADNPKTKRDEAQQRALAVLGRELRSGK